MHHDIGGPSRTPEAGALGRSEDGLAGRCRRPVWTSARVVEYICTGDLHPRASFFSGGPPANLPRKVRAGRQPLSLSSARQPGESEAQALNVAVGAEPFEQGAEPATAPVVVPVWTAPEVPDWETTGTVMVSMLPGQPNEPVMSPETVMVAEPVGNEPSTVKYRMPPPMATVRPVDGPGGGPAAWMSSENVPDHLAVVEIVASIGPDGLRATRAGAFVPAHASCTYNSAGQPADGGGVAWTVTGLGVLAGVGLGVLAGVLRGAGAVVGLEVATATG